MIKLENSNYDKNSKTQIGTKLKNSNCDDRATELQSYTTTELQRVRVTHLRIFTVAKLHSYTATELESFRVTKLLCSMGSWRQTLG